MGVDLLKILVSYCFLLFVDFRKKKIIDLEKIKKYMVLVTYENFKIIIYIILNQKITSSEKIRFETTI